MKVMSNINAHVYREEKLNEKFRREAKENAKKLIEKNHEKAGGKDKTQASSYNKIQKEGVSCEITILDSV